MPETICWNRRDHVLPQRFDFGRDFRLDIGQPFHTGAQEGLGRRELLRPYARDAFAEQQQVVFGNLDGLVHHAHRAHLVEILGAGSFHARIELRNHRERAVLAQRLHQRQRSWAGPP